MTDLLTRLEAMLTPNADGLLPCQQHSDASLSDLSIEDGHDGQTFAIDCWCGVRGPDSMTRDGAILAWNSRPFLRALVEAVKRSRLTHAALGDLLYSRDIAWEQTGQGHDWADCVNGAVQAHERSQGFDAALLAILEGKP